MLLSHEIEPFKAHITHDLSFLNNKLEKKVRESLF